MSIVADFKQRFDVVNPQNEHSKEHQVCNRLVIKGKVFPKFIMNHFVFVNNDKFSTYY